MALICIDWDHTIIDTASQTLLPGVHEAFDRLRMAGHRIMIFSCNNPAFIRQRCDELNLRPDYIYGELGAEDGKPNAAIFIDDRGLRFNGDWWTTIEATLDFLEYDK